MRSHIQIHDSVKHQLLVISISMLLFPLTCKAATFTVINTNDSGPGSLRQAIASSNGNQQADTIIFDPVIFASPQVIFLTTGELRVLRDLQPSSGTVFNISIIGPGPELLTIDANHNSRIFFSQDGNYIFSLSGMTLTHGFATKGGAIHSRNYPNFSNIVVTENLVEGGDLGPPGQFYGGRGGGIFAEGGLLIRDSTFSNNIARGILLPGNQNVGDYGTAGAGGAIATAFPSYVIHCNFINNMAQGVTSSIPPPGLRAGMGGTAFGGAIYGAFDVNIINSIFSDNSAIAGDGGSITSTGTAGDGGTAYGGALMSSGSRVLNTAFVDNTAHAGNGGSHPTPTAIGRGGDAFGGAIYETGGCKMANLTVHGNFLIAGAGLVGGNGFGGGISLLGSNQWRLANLTVTDNVNTAGSGTQTNGMSQGGGIYFLEENTPDFRNTIVAENVAETGTDIFGNFPISFNNLIRIGGGFSGFSNGVNGNMVGTIAAPIDPLLGPLSDNGGVTDTRALLSGSPAINTGNNTVLNPFNSQALLFDQRNFQRQGPAGTVDIGAFEYGTPAFPVTPSRPDLQNASDTGASNNDDITNSTAPVFDITNTIGGATVELLRDGVVVASGYSDLFSLSITDPDPPLDGVVQYASRQTIAGVSSNLSGTLTVTFDNTRPTATIDQAVTQSDPTRLLPIRFTAVFSEKVVNPGTVSLVGSTATTTFAFFNSTSADGIIWEINVSGVTANGATVVASLTGNYQDLAGNVGVPSTSTDNVVTLDNVRPAVQINQAGNQPDPTSAQPINFSVIFSEQVTGLTASGVSLSGSTANVSAAMIEVTGSGTEYNVAISNIRSSGIVKAAIIANTAADLLGNLNFGSMSMDNSVTFIRRNAQYDFDADGKSDISVFRPSTGAWYLQNSSAGLYGTLFGYGDDKIAPADFDGDGKTDIAVYRPDTGIWYIFNSLNGTVSYNIFGLAEDLPTPADYDGDGKADISVFRPSTGTWYRQNSNNGSFSAIQFGLSEDKPTVGDFDADGKADIAIFRPSVGDWYRLNSSDGTVSGARFGFGTDIIVPADYDGDGRTDLAVYRPSTGIWYITNSSNGSVTYNIFGLSDDIPAPGDFDGDGKADVSVFRPSTGTWYRQNSSDGSFFAYQFGTNGDEPTQTAFIY